MELSNFDNGILNHKNNIQMSIVDKGYFVMHEKGYSYTIGFNNIDIPELIMFDDNQKVLTEIFQVIYGATKRDLLKINSFLELEQYFEPKINLKNISESEKKQYFYSARIFYGHWNFNSAQISL